MGYDGKYGQITTQFGDIPDEEPVFVFRGRDRLLVQVLDFYARLCEGNGSPANHVQLVRETRERLDAWQADHSEDLRTPASEDYFRRVDDGEQESLT